MQPLTRCLPRTRYWLLVAALTVFAIAPLTYPGFFQVHSGFLTAFNAAHPSEAPNWRLSAEQIDVVRGEGQLPYLLASPMYALSGSGGVAVKWGYALAFLVGALGVYAWTRRWLDDRGAVLAAVVYTYLPWRLATVYVRGAYAEAWLWAFYPFALWAVDRLAERRLSSILIAASIGLAALAAVAWTQPGLAALLIFVLVAYGVVMAFDRERMLVRLVLTAALLLLLLWQMARSASEQPVPFADHFLYPYQLLSAAWGFGVSIPGWQDGLPFQLGVAAVGLTVVALALLARSRSEVRRELGRPLLFWTMVLAVSILLTLSPSAFVWQLSRLESFLTYPWQVLALTGVPLAFLAGSVARLDKRLAALPAWAGLLVLVILASYPYLAPRFTQVDPGPEPVAMFQPDQTSVPQLMILDYEIAPPTEITPTLTLTLTWQAVAPVAEDYTVFVHLLDAAGDKIVQRDTRPCDSECPTNTWQPGEIIVDRYELTLPADALPGPHRLAVGLYLLETGKRLSIAGRDDRTVYLHVP